MKKVFRVLSMLMAVIIACMCMTVGVSADSAVEEAEKGVVLIESDYGWGSGFAVGKSGENPKYIVTNVHVINHKTLGVSSSITVWFSAAANKFMRAEVIAADTSKDLCVLELPETTSERKALQLCKSDNVSKGDEVFTLGYPDYADKYQSYQALDIDDITSTKGSISQKTRINNSGAIGTNVYLTDATISNGNSGGPMINKDGAVIGINTWGIKSYSVDVTNDGDFEIKEEFAGTTGGYATIVDELISLLNSKNIPYEIAGESEPTPEPAPEPTPEPTPEPALEPASKPASKPASNTDSNTAVIVIGVVAIAAVAAIVVCLIIVKNKNKATSAPGTNKTSSAAVIIGVKGAMANRSFNIGGGLVLGRNPQQCSVSYPIDTKGVSGVHCQIRQCGSGYELVDLGSSNGTYIGNGQKLAPNVPAYLANGSYFYLGSTEQMFQIKY